MLDLMGLLPDQHDVNSVVHADRQDEAKRQHIE